MMVVFATPAPEASRLDAASCFVDRADSCAGAPELSVSVLSWIRNHRVLNLTQWRSCHPGSIGASSFRLPSCWFHISVSRVLQDGRVNS